LPERGPAAASATRVCIVPRLAGASLGVARRRALHAGCALRVYELPADTSLRGRPRLRADQLVTRQTPRAGSLAHAVSLFVRPLCLQPADPGPPAGEPFVRRGPTELVSGLFLAGGPIRARPRCRAGVSSPGRLRVLDPASGRARAVEVVAAGRLAVISLAPGRYVIQGTFANAFRNGQPIQSRPVSVAIEAGKTTRLDVVADIK
jgi:hypothetical protein